ncbi:MAG: VWA domain-containing protein, partial [Candidatus Marinimicrobia bacterium]|nr:VWA domain-containing protein [Candidatus Neomarinimicrobiota bacterium]
KTDRFYIKQFEEETNLKAHIMLDTPKSMAFASREISKLQYGSFVSSALAYLLLRQQDAVGLTLFDDEIRTHIRPSSRPSMLNNILAQLENAEAGNQTAIGRTLHQLADRIHRRGLVIIISDMLDEIEHIMHGLKHFRHDKHEVLVFHVLDPREVDFAFDAHATFEDMESGEIKATEPWHIQKAYQEAVEQFRTSLARQCRELHVDYIPLRTDQPLDIALLAYLNKRHSVM